MSRVLSATPPTAKQRRIRSRLVKKHKTLVEAAQRAEPRISYSTLRSVIYRKDVGKLSHATVQSFLSLGIPENWLPNG